MNYGHLSTIKDKKYGFGAHLNDKQGTLLELPLVIVLLRQDAHSGNHCLRTIARERLSLQTSINVTPVFFRKNAIVHQKKDLEKRIVLNDLTIHSANDARILYGKRSHSAKMFCYTKFVFECLLNTIMKQYHYELYHHLDSWYASAENLKLVHRANRLFYTTLKANRLVSLTNADGYIHLDAMDWTPERCIHGVLVRLQKVPFPVRLFKLVATNSDIDWVITNNLDSMLTTQAVQDANDVRWQVEALHRGLKQLTGIERCQCRKARSQRNHLACCYHAWLSLNVHAKRVGKTLYQIRTDLFRDYLRSELANPHICAL